MGAFWVTFDNDEELCVEGKTEAEAVERVQERTIKSIQRLPYPAHPRMQPPESYPDGKGGEYHVPSFCYKPRECAGRGSCPQRYSCTE